jgi:hypothetical protein
MLLRMLAGKTPLRRILLSRTQRHTVLFKTSGLFR